MILELVNGGIKEIYTDTNSTGGCSTCDYGSSYVNEFTVYMTTGTIYIEAGKMYDYPLSEGYLMTLMLQNVDEIKEMTERGFFEWIKNAIESNDEVEELDRCEFIENGMEMFK